jgi:hypothetical protein
MEAAELVPDAMEACDVAEAERGCHRECGCAEEDDDRPSLRGGERVADAAIPGSLHEAQWCRAGV